MKIDHIGTIQSGDNTGWQVKIVDDSQNTGGYLILISKNFSQPESEGYDDWVESKESLEKYIQESKWVIDWH